MHKGLCIQSLFVCVCVIKKTSKCVCDQKNVQVCVWSKNVQLHTYRSNTFTKKQYCLFLSPERFDRYIDSYIESYSPRFCSRDCRPSKNLAYSSEIVLPTVWINTNAQKAIGQPQRDNSCSTLKLQYRTVCTAQLTVLGAHVFCRSTLVIKFIPFSG